MGWLGLSEPVVRTLRPHVVLLPRETPVNLNTAPKEVIAAVLPGIDLAGAQRLGCRRASAIRCARPTGRRVLGERALTDARRISVNSAYFRVTGALRLDTMMIAQRSLIERQGREARLLSTRRLTDPLELQALLQP